jgi:NAD+ synthase
LESGNNYIRQQTFGSELDSSLVKVLTDFIRNETERFGVRKCVIGLSGGVDSSAAAFLAVRAVGEKNLTGLMLPYKTSGKDSIKDALRVAALLKIKTKVIDLTPAVDGLINACDTETDKVRRGNIIARMRMAALYDYSHQIGGLVIGTGNKTEILLGYTTVFGDAASAINPMGDLYKTQVWQLAKVLGVPKDIVDKKPTADLWVGQSDEAEIGIAYKKLDQFLYYMVDLRYTDAELKELGYRMDFINKIRTKVRRNQFKRLPPVIAKVSNRTINVDFRYNRDQNS